MKRKSLLAILLAASMAASMTAATATVAFAETEEAAEETTDDAEAADDAEASPLAGRLFCPSRAERRCALTLFTSTTKNVRRAGGGTLCVFCFRQ